MNEHMSDMYYKPILARDIERFNHARMIAALSQVRFRMGAVIHKGRKLVSVGVNVLKTHTDHSTKYGRHVISIHAEHAAILKARFDVTGATIYIARDGGRDTSKPCADCMEYMRHAGIKTIVYSINGTLVKEIL